MQTVATTVARALLEIDAISFNPQEPVTFKSGIVSPVYMDNRRLPYWPIQWERVIRGFYDTVIAKNILFDVIAGIETAGIPHSAVFAYTMQRPSVFVRKQAKEHGQRKQVEGGNVKDERVLLIEDLVTTGGSSLRGVAALRAEGATVTDCMTIISYGLPEARHMFAQAGVTLHTLTTFETVLAEATVSGHLLHGELTIIEDWLKDPHGWAAKYGHATS